MKPSPPLLVLNIIRLLRKHLSIFRLVIPLSILLSLVDFAATFTIANFFQFILGDNNSFFSINVLSGHLFLPFVLFITVLGCRYFLSKLFLSRLYSTIYTYSVKVSSRYFESILSSYSASLAFSKKGRFVKLISEDVDLLVNGVITPIAQLLTETLLVILLLSYLSFTISFATTFLSIILIVPVSILFIRNITDFSIKLGVNRNNSIVQRQKFLSEASLSLPEIYIFGAKDFALNKLTRINSEFAKTSSLHTQSIQLNRILLELVLFVSLSFLLLSLSSSNSNSLSANFPVLVAVLLRILPSISRILQLSQGIFYLIPTFANHSEQKLLTQYHTDVNFSYNLEASSSSLLFTNINLSREEKTLLRSSRLELPLNQFISISGESGSGKSSLAHSIFLALREHGYRVCLLRQTPGVISSDLTEAVSLSTASVDKHSFQKSLIDAGFLQSTIQEMLDKKLTTYNLSGGQLQRLLLARSFYHSFDFLLLDEFTSALDIATELKILHTISAMCRRGLTVLGFTHSISVRKFSTLGYHISNTSLLIDSSI